MRLSVLMPVFNERKTLPEIIHRVLRQNIPGISSTELVIVDDCSTDSSKDTIKELALKHSEIKMFVPAFASLTWRPATKHFAWQR